MAFLPGFYTHFRRGAHQHSGPHERSSAVNMKSPAAKDCEGCGATRATWP